MAAVAAVVAATVQYLHRLQQLAAAVAQVQTVEQVGLVVQAAAGGNKAGLAVLGLQVKEITEVAAALTAAALLVAVVEALALRVSQQQQVLLVV